MHLSRRLFGTGPMRVRPLRPTIHASQRPAELADINLLELGLRFLPNKVEISKAPSAYSPPPDFPPDLPFTVRYIKCKELYFFHT